jgi:hypothetical protein
MAMDRFVTVERELYTGRQGSMETCELGTRCGVANEVPDVQPSLGGAGYLETVRPGYM